jgi:hypothetical protein
MTDFSEICIAGFNALGLQKSTRIPAGLWEMLYLDQHRSAFWQACGFVEHDSAILHMSAESHCIAFEVIRC